jgi:hypothetical protein
MSDISLYIPEFEKNNTLKIGQIYKIKGTEKPGPYSIKLQFGQTNTGMYTNTGNYTIHSPMTYLGDNKFLSNNKVVTLSNPNDDLTNRFLEHIFYKIIGNIEEMK